jgi:hypothetical protein
MVGRGAGRPPYCIRSADHRGDQAVPLADLIGEDAPPITLAIGAQRGCQDAITLQIHHNGVNGALMAPGVQSHRADDLSAGELTVLNQNGADGGADDAVEVHRGGVVN